MRSLFDSPVVVVAGFAGDYTLVEKLFGQTSNNAERMKLKAEVLAKADIPTNPSLVSIGTAGRFVA